MKSQTHLLVLSAIILTAACGKTDPTAAGNPTLERSQSTTEQPAKSASINRTAFSVSYPFNWTLDTKDEDYDPDHLFSIDASDGSMVMVVIKDEVTNPASASAAFVASTEKAFSLSNTSRLQFRKWGQYDGVGYIITGNASSVPITTKIFSLNSAGKTITIILHAPDEELKDVGPGFKEVEETFTVFAPKAD